MWERLVEIALFCRSGTHRQPGQILKAFIKTAKSEEAEAITAPERKKLSKVFDFLDIAYEQTDLGESRFARDLPHFYTMVTVLLKSNLLVGAGAAPNFIGVRDKLVKFAKLLDGKPATATITASLDIYKQSAAKQTTHPSQRQKRNDEFLKIMGAL